MSDQNKAIHTVEVPREVADRILMVLDQGNAFNCAADLRACIKPRRWVFDKYTDVNCMDKGVAAFSSSRTSEYPTLVRMTVEEAV